VSGAAARDGGSIPEEKPAYRRLFTCTSPLRSRRCRTRSTQVEEFIADPHRVVDGRIALPQGPGLGVEVDRQKLEYLARRNEEEGDLIFDADEKLSGEPPYMGQW
jgi:hypothetical protein